MQGFVEMMSAYFPDFSQIETNSVYQWIVQLESHMSKEKKSNAGNNTLDASKK